MQLQASALDVNGATVAVTPGSFNWTLISGNAFLSITTDGIATLTAAGLAKVRVTVDGITSPLATVTVSSPPPNALTLGEEANDLVYNSVASRIWAVVPTNAIANANSAVATDPLTGAVTKSIFLGVEASRIAVPDNGQFAYVIVDGDATAWRVNLVAGTVVATYSVKQGGSYVDLARCLASRRASQWPSTQLAA